MMGMTPQSFKVIQESPLLSTKEYREMLEILEGPIVGHHPRTIALAKKTRSTLARMLYQLAACGPRTDPPRVHLVQFSSQ